MNRLLTNAYIIFLILILLLLIIPSNRNYIHLYVTNSINLR
jgi:hypothetical protein